MGKKYSESMKGVRFTSVDDVVRKAAKKHKVPINTLPGVERRIRIEKPRAILKAARNLDLAEGECVGRNLVRIEKSDAAGLLKYDVTPINAWARGDLEALRSIPAPDPDLKREDCMTAALDAALKSATPEQRAQIGRGVDLIKQQEDLNNVAGEEAERNWVDAAEAALAKNESTFAVLPMHLVTNEWVYVGSLKGKGYVVEAPDEQRGSVP